MPEFALGPRALEPADLLYFARGHATVARQGLLRCRLLCFVRCGAGAYGGFAIVLVGRRPVDVVARAALPGEVQGRQRPPLPAGSRLHHSAARAFSLTSRAISRSLP